MKRVLSIIISIFMMFTICITYAGAETTNATLYSYYGNNMLFKQNDEAVLAGSGTPGAEISCILTNSSQDAVARSNSTINQNGTFNISFHTPAGGYDEYTISLYVNNKMFAELKNVVFGELWLAGGQSNMQMPLSQSETGMQMFANGITGSDSLRFLAVPAQGGYNGDINCYPAAPIADFATGAQWYKGSDAAVFNMSAVGYYFAQKLIDELDMPVGILNANLGGTSILTWLSRESIENDPFVFANCKSDNRYIALTDWKENEVNPGIDMTCNFNDKIAPLKNFRLSGMIWYQGETDLFWDYGKYTRAFDLLQESYTSLFGYSDGLLPIVYTQLASYSYGNLDTLQNKNDEFAKMQLKEPESRAVVPIYDIPLTYREITHAIHPICKKEVGERMAFSALGMVYNTHDTYTAAFPQKTENKNGNIFITFSNTGDGLVCEDQSIYGFSVCGKDGVYLAADAQIISEDVVCVSNPDVEKPVSVAYAYSQTNNNANLYASEDGVKTLAVSPFVTNRFVGTHYWHNDAWADCEYDTFWHCHSNEFSGNYNTWNAESATIRFAENVAYHGNKSLQVSSDGNSATFSISPNFMYNNNGTEMLFEDIDNNWTDYGTLSFYAKVKSTRDIEFKEVKITIDNNRWYTAKIIESDASSRVIKADDNWHCVSVDLNKLYLYGNMAAASYSGNILNNITDVDFVFSDTYEHGADIYFDNVTFTADTTDHDLISGEAEYDKASSFWQKIVAFFLTIFAKLTAIFN